MIQQNISKKICSYCGVLKPAQDFQKYSTVCGKCRYKKYGAYNKEKRRERLLNGFCLWCSSKVEDGKKLCSRHLKIQNERQNRKRKEIRSRAVDYLGGRCKICNVIDSSGIILDFHHHTEKDRNLSNIMLWLDWKKVLLEIDKCYLMCANCHREETHREIGQNPKNKRRLDKKIKAIDHLGSTCHLCGSRFYNAAIYDFHHVDSDEKEISIARALDHNRSFDSIKCELDKCILLCANCHRILHYTLNNN